MLPYLIISLGFLVTTTNGVVLGCLGNPCEQICVNVIFSILGYECKCRSGYMVDTSNSRKCIPLAPSCGRGYQNSKTPPYNCVDTDECSSGTSQCEQNCRNSDGSYECTCRSGYVVSLRDPTRCERESAASCRKGFQPNPKNPSNCIDIDECTTNSPCQQLCSNSEGSFECGCRSGYQLNEADPTRCDIINNCRKGYKPNPLNPTQCDDVDECRESNPCAQLCSNTDGGFICSCRDGFEVSAANSAQCVEADKCKKSPCEQICTSTNLGFQCSCRKGYKIRESYPTICDDVDECKDNPCEQVCSNTVGSYACSCRTGYTVSAANSAKCESVDKCSTSPCEQTCTSTGSGFACSCKKGYNISPSDNTKCVDIDECKGNNPCEHNCDNTKGSYKCSCRDGFSVDPNNQNKCVGTDACSVGRRCEHRCTVISTGRKCSCNPGFVVNDEDNTLCDKIEVCKAKADVLLIFDASSSIGAEHYDKQFVFAKRLTSNFNIGATAVRFAGLVFSRFAKVLFNLKDHNNIESVHKALSNVEYMDSSTYTHEALETVDKQQLFSSAKGGRDDDPDVIVLFTDGNPTYEDRAIEAAQKLKDKKVLIIGVGIGSGLDMAVLKKISSTPDDAVEASSYDTLDYIEKRLTQILCDLSKSG